MARANLLNTDTKNFLDLLGNGKLYRVPPYQRDYSWKEEQWEDLWADIVSMRNDPSARHYMGALVVEAKSDREFLIIDGQQRVATLSVLALAIIKQLWTLADEGVDSEANRERADLLRERFIGAKDPTSLTLSSKLFLNITDNEFYQDYLVQLREPLNPRSLPTSNALLWNCFRFFQSEIAADKELSSSGEALASLLNETVARKLLFILIVVEDDLNAYTVFETLNARGLELSATDLLKNYLFSLIKGKQDLEALGRRWHRLVTTVRQKEFPKFLRFHLLCEEPKIRQQRLFKYVRDRVRTPEDVFRLIDQLEARGELFAAIDDPDHGYWRDLPDARAHIQELKLFRVRQPMPALFAAWEKMDGQDFVRTLKLLVAFSFRYTVIGGQNPNDLESLYHEIAKGLLNESIKGPAGAFQILRRLYPSDDRFHRDFADASIGTSGQKQKLVRYILMRLENQAHGTHLDWLTDPATIEHILPENPSAEWDEVIRPESQPQYIYRIGNLALLETRLNRDAANRSFDDKRPLYAQSNYKMTAALDRYAPNEWNTAAIEKRQKRLAEHAVAAWRSDFQGNRL